MEPLQQFLSVVANMAQIIGTIWLLCWGSITLPQAIRRIHAWWVSRRSTPQLLLPETDNTTVTAGSVGAQAAVATDTNALQETLCELFHFTPDDLERNREGRVSESQRKRLKKDAIFTFEVFVFCVLFVSVGLSFLVPPVLVSGICVIALILIALGVRNLKNALGSIRYGPTVAKDVGPIRQKEEVETNGGLAAATGYSYSYFVRDVRLPGTWTVPLTLSSLTYHVFSATDIGVGKKFLSIEPCLETPVCSSVIILRTRS